MFEIQTYIIYISLFVVMFLLARLASKTGKWTYMFIGLLIYSIVFGIRYDVGFDYLAYYDIYTSKMDLTDFYFESGFKLIIISLQHINAHFAWFFGLIAFMQIFFVSKSIKPDKYVYQYFVFTFMIGCTWLVYANGLRQVLAFAIFVYSIRFIEQRKLVNYCIAIVVAMLMHKTALLLFVIYPILCVKEDWTGSVKIQLICLVIAFLLSEIRLIQNVLGYVEDLAIVMGYEKYFETKNEETYKLIENTELSKGLGFYILFALDIVLVGFSNKYKKYFNNRFLLYIYNLYFIGSLIHYPFLTTQLIARLNMYFYGLKYIIAAYCMVYVKRKNFVIFFLLIMLYILTFIATLSKMDINDSMYKFYWQM